MGGEGGVISAAVLHVKDQHKIQNPGFQLRIFAVGPENVKDILRRGKAGHRGMDEKAVSVMVMAVGLIAVDAQDREKSDELDALAQQCGVSARTITRHREYIVAAALLIDGDYPILCTYLQTMRKEAEQCVR